MGRGMGKREGQGCRELSTPRNQGSIEYVGGFYTSCPGMMEYCNLLFFLNFTIIVLCVLAFVCMHIAGSGCGECIAFSGIYRQAGTDIFERF